MRIEFSPDTQPLPRTELLTLLSVAEGKPLQREDVRQSLRSLFATGRFAEISVDAESSDDGVALSFRTESTFFVSGVTVEGVANPPNRSQLSNAAKLELGSGFSEDAVERSVANMQERLRSNGLYRAKLDSEIDRVPETEEAVAHFTLKSGPRARKMRSGEWVVIPEVLTPAK